LSHGGTGDPLDRSRNREVRRDALVRARRARPDARGEDGEFLEATAANGDKLEIFGPTGPQPAYQFAAAPVVVGFLVDDIEAARNELAAAPGVELLGELEVMEDGYAWQHFRAPDGLVYELTFDPRAA